jgi:hypothetical protein
VNGKTKEDAVKASSIFLEDAWAGVLKSDGGKEGKSVYFGKGSPKYDRRIMDQADV